ncbi:hypothetical protein BC332_10760 [Capsicum chinense]|nr:hypothetical protein BC332_10760 [Capsicum chinense]
MSRVGSPNIASKFSNSSLLCLRVSRSVELVLSGPSAPGVWGTRVAGSGGLVMKVSAWELDIWTPYNTSSIQEAGVLFGAGGVEMKSRGDVLLPMLDSIGRALEEDSSRFGKGVSSFLRPFFQEVSRILDSGNSSCLIELNVIFVKKLITLAIDRKNREKEMASVLLSSVCFPADDVVNGFVMLIESADDAALDISIIVEDLAMFLARAEVDEVLTPQHMKKLTINFSSRIQCVLLFDDVPKKKRV